MKTFSIYEPPKAASDRLDRAESLVFVKEGFTWTAMAFAPVWMLFNRLWLAFLAYLAALILIRTGAWAFNIGPATMNLAIIALHVLIGFEADSIKRLTLEWQGWNWAGTVAGRSASECERRFFDDWLPRQPMIRPETLSGPGSLGASNASPLSGPERAPELTQARTRIGGWRSSRIFGGPK